MAKINWILQMLMVSILLNSCNGHHNSMHMYHGENCSDNGQTFKKNDFLICPACQGGGRYLYKLSSDKNNSIVLMCEECSSVWLDPNKIEWGQIASRKILKNEFETRHYYELFDENASWATRKEAFNNKKWKEFLEKNPSCVKQ